MNESLKISASSGNDSNPRKVFIITSVDDDQEKLLSYLNEKSVESYVLDIDQTKGNAVTSISPSSKGNSTIKKRKADLTCVICGGQAIGYNFNQISCESCKAFFRRNALQPLEKIKCLSKKGLTNEIQCPIRSEMKQKCPRCRLLKCFQSGMRKDFILTNEEKMAKKQRLEENRRLRLSHDEKNSLPPQSIPSEQHSYLTTEHWTYLNQIQQAYSKGSQSIPSASSVLSLELAPDKMSAFMNTLDVQNFTALKLINFFRDIDQFAQLNEHDRLILVKYNLTLIFLVHHSLRFDPQREICYDLEPQDTLSSVDEAFAQHCKSLFILCYGYEFHQIATKVLHALLQVTGRDPIVIQLLMLIMIFGKGLAADDDQEPNLNEPQKVFHAQAKYIDLLFRYFLDKFPFEQVIRKMTQIMEQLFVIQKVSRNFQHYIKRQVDINHVNPLMKSLLHLT